ncbi:MAG: ATP-binding protein [Deltaproteobacteria bacterium]|nr:MAG: ATP-binding protein [Deltaproteobacteria bacterium]
MRWRPGVVRGASSSRSTTPPHGRPTVRPTVRDDGCGMTPEVRARLVEPFYSTKGHGRGLGMASIAHVVDALAGEIEIDSTVGTGTTVTVRRPRCTPPP